MFSSVTKQLKRARSAVKSVLAIAGTASAALDPKLRSYLREGEQLDSLERVQLTTVRWIEDDHNQLEEQEANQRTALRQLRQMRLRRDEEQEILYSKLLRIRQTFEDAFGSSKAAIFLGLEPRLSDVEPVALRRQASETAKILSDPQFEAPETLVQGLWENPARYAEQILEALGPFEATLDNIESQKREVEKALKAKTDLLEQLNDRLRWSIQLFEAIYRLADLGFHADRLRLTVSSRSKVETLAEEVSASDEPESGAEGVQAGSEPSQGSEPPGPSQPKVG